MADFDASVRSVRATLEDFRFDHYVYLSSCDVYPDCSSPALTAEDRPLDTSRQSPYGFHKHLAEQCVRRIAENWSIFRLGGFVGPGLKKNAIFDILHGGPMWLDPSSELQFLSTDRAAAAVFQVIDSGHSREVMNLCGRGVVRLQDVIDWTGQAVQVSPGSPLVRYEVAIAKISSIVELPETRATVREFVDDRLQRR